jgi:hypothetical protein
MNEAVIASIPGKKEKCIVDNMESSDDSSFIISFPTMEGNISHNLAMMIAANSWFERKELLGYYLGIYKSPKSTTNTPFVMEFNSEFFFAGDVHRPTFRWVNACILIGEQETLAGIQEEFSNTLKDVIEGGGTYYLTFVCQVAQAILHYRMLGSSVSSVWPAYKVLIRRSWDPALGYFLMDNIKCAGLLGFNYNLWNACSTTSLGEKYEEMVQLEMSAEKPSLRQVTEDTINTGLFSRTTMVGQGNKKKWIRMMSKLKLNEDTYNSIEENPRIYFFHANNPSEFIQKVAIKMKSPGVIQSLSKGNILSKKIATSAFFLSRHIVFTMSAYYDVDPETRKTSLIRELIHSSGDTELILWSNSVKPTFVKDIMTRDPNPQTSKNFIELTHEIIPVHTERDPKNVLALINAFSRKRLDTDFFDLSPINQSKVIANLNDLNLIMYRQIYNRTFGLIYQSLNTERRKSNLYVYLFKTGEIELQVNLKNDFVDRSRTMRDSASLKEIMGILFPNNGDYISIKETLAQISFDNACIEKNVRRRVRADIQLTGTEGVSKFPLYAAAVWCWFGTKTMPAHESVYAQIWNTYKQVFTWLRDTMDETIKDGPFTTGQGIVNFISRNREKSRVIHLVGAFGRNVKGNINLVTAIRDNFSNGVTFKGDIFDIKAKENKESLESYLSIMTTLIHSPLGDALKTGLMRILLVRGASVRRNVTHWGSRRNKLSMIQDIMREDPDLSYQGVSVPWGSVKEMLINNVEKQMPIVSVDEFEHAINSIEDFMSSIMAQGKKPIINVTSDRRIQLNFKHHEVMMYSFWEMGDDIEESTNEYNDYAREMIEPNAIKKFESLHRADPTANWIYMVKDGRIKAWQDYVRIRDKFIPDRTNYIADIRQEKLGILGCYTIVQKHEDGNYYGPGTWRGTFDNRDVEIQIDGGKNESPIITRVTISDTSDITTFLLQLKAWCRDNHIENHRLPRKWNDVSLKKEIILCCMLDFRKSTINSDMCPIIYNSYLSTKEQTEITKLVVDVTDHSIRLRHRPKKGRDLTIMSMTLFKSDIQVYRTLPSELHSELRQRREDIIFTLRSGTKELPEWVTDWLLWRSSKNDQDNLINLINDGESSRNQLSSSSVKSWISSLFSSSVDLIINHKSFLINSEESSDPGSSEEAPEIDFKVEFANVMEQLENLMLKGFLDGVINSACIKNLMQIPQVSTAEDIEEKVYKDDLTRSHPLMHTAVRDMVRIIGMTTFQRFMDDVRSRKSPSIMTDSIRRYKNLFMFVFPHLTENDFERSTEHVICWPSV